MYYPVFSSRISMRCLDVRSACATINHEKSKKERRRQKENNRKRQQKQRITSAQLDSGRSTKLESASSSNAASSKFIQTI